MSNNELGPLILDVGGLSLSKSDIQILKSPVVGGVILFSRNFESWAQLQLLVSQIRSCRQELLICVDHEGGRVQRFREEFTRIPSMQRLAGFTGDNLDVVKDVGWLMASELIAIGIDFSFAPVLDLDEAASKVIGDRSFSNDPQRVSIFAAALIEGMHEAGMAVTGKHFPGHGGVVADSHLELPVDGRGWDALVARDLIPFQSLISQLDAVMPAHILFPAVDNMPVGFSSVWLKTILREKLHYQGVIFSDDLSMEGASTAGGYAKRAQQALEAGCDAVLVCNNRGGADEVVCHLEGQKGVGSQRLSSMRRRQHIDNTSLRHSQRWINIVQSLAQVS